MFIFEKLEVYQKAVAFADQVSRLTADFPRGHWYLADQFNRASLSIALNIAEGNGRWSLAEKRNFFSIARGSVHECVPLIELCYRKSLFPQQTCNELKETLEVLAKMLAGLIGKNTKAVKSPAHL
jgi:four helix bundle protein